MNPLKPLLLLTLALTLVTFVTGCETTDDDDERPASTTTTTTVEESHVAPAVTRETRVERY